LLKPIKNTPDAPSDRRYLLILSLGALGVVYGDIGTSPLYAMRECFFGPHAMPVTRDNIFGVLSLVFWSLILVISVKYLVFVMRADNRGEGGIMSLMSLISPRVARERISRRGFLLGVGLFGAALLYGDGIITPAITVLSAIEGLNVATPFFQPYVIPITIVILIRLFFLQRRGTAGIGALFGPLMIVWFATIATLGLIHVVRVPSVLQSLNPVYSVRFMLTNQWHGFLVLGTVFLVVTGGEALYADMGHFGRKPIRLAWFVIVLPALVINYLGQGALLMRDPSAAQFLFYKMAPSWALYPLVVLATLAASVASQAVISGAFSLTRQAVQLGFSPRLGIDHTSAREIGQIYIPGINWALMLATIGLVLGFKSSSNLAAAYGVAVTTTMVITTMLLYVVARERWKWSRFRAIAMTAPFLAIDLAFFGANIVKVGHGGWFPLVVAAIVFTVMTTWRTGRKILNRHLREGSLPVDVFLKSLKLHPPHRVPGTAVFMHRDADSIPPALLHSMKHYKVLHERLVLLTVITQEVPHLADESRVTLEDMGQEIYRLVVRYGFMEDPNIPQVLEGVQHERLNFNPMETTYFLGRESLIATDKPGMALWREKLFAWMVRNATSATFYFRLPPNRVVELGSQIEI